MRFADVLRGDVQVAHAIEARMRLEAALLSVTGGIGTLSTSEAVRSRVALRYTSSVVILPFASAVNPSAPSFNTFSAMAVELSIKVNKGQ